MYSAAGVRELSYPFNHLSGPIGNDILNHTKLTNLEFCITMKKLCQFTIYTCDPKCLRVRNLEDYFSNELTLAPTPPHPKKKNKQTKNRQGNLEVPWSVLEIPIAEIVNNHVLYPLNMVAISLCATQNCSFFLSSKLGID